MMNRKLIKLAFVVMTVCCFPGSVISQVVISTSEPLAVNLHYQKSSLSSSIAFSDSDMYLDRGQKVYLHAEVSNQGSGKAYDVICYLSGEVPDGIRIQRKAVLGIVYPGKKKIISFLVQAEKTLADCYVPLTFSVTEKFERFPPPIEINLACRAGNTSRQLKPTVIKTMRARDSLDTHIPATDHSNPFALAVVIGNRDYYFSSEGPFEYAQNDAQTVKNYLTDVFGYAPDNIIHNRNVTRDFFCSVFGTDEEPGELQQHIRPDTTDVFIYYSGYGITDIETKHPYLIPSEYTFDKKEIMKECYPVELLLRNLNDLSPRSVTIILDTCFAIDTEPIDGGITGDFLSSLNGNIVTIVAASPGETANRYHEFMHGLFTWRFITSLNETLAARDTTLTAGELFEMLTGGDNGISSMSANIFNGKAQHPQFFGNPEQIILEVK